MQQEPVYGTYPNLPPQQGPVGVPQSTEFWHSPPLYNNYHKTEQAPLLEPSSFRHVGPTNPDINNAADQRILIKAKYSHRYKQFAMNAPFRIQQLGGELTFYFDIPDAQVNLGTAYLLWLLFGWLGVHRWYLKKHSALSWFLWFITGQFFGIGWLYDGFTMHWMVTKRNKRALGKENEAPVCNDITGFCAWRGENLKPNPIVAYLLWFFFGFLGVHRWYTGRHTPASFIVWLITGQLFGLGWLWDIYYTYHMCKHPQKYSYPFSIKVFDGQHDYLPVWNDEQLAEAVTIARTKSNGVLRVYIEDLIKEDIAWAIWFLFGIIGGHMLYIRPDLGISNFLLRLCTANYFGIGWIVEGIYLQEMILKRNILHVTDFHPSSSSTYLWPGVTAAGYRLFNNSVDEMLQKVA